MLAPMGSDVYLLSSVAYSLLSHRDLIETSRQLRVQFKRLPSPFQSTTCRSQRVEVPLLTILYAMHRLLTIVPIAALCFSALCAAPTSAQQQEPTDVSVGSVAGDTVGRRLVYEVKEELRDSSAFNLVEPSENTIMLLINTMPRNESNPSAATIYSITWVFPDESGFSYFLDGKIGHVRSDLIKVHAQDIVASTDGVISDILDMARRAEESLDDEGGRE